MSTDSRNNSPVAIIGAGLAGLTTAVTLREAGVPGTLFDKGRGPGGRMSTRRESEYRFDHGAQYFCARDERFRRTVAQWVRAGVAKRWDVPISMIENGRITNSPELTPRYVGTPGMSAVIGHLASVCEVSFATRVSTLWREGGQWAIRADGGLRLGSYERVLIAVPPAQAVQILGGDVGLVDPLRRISMLPCWALMVAFESKLDLPFDAARVHSSPLSWVARNGSKPQRPPAECWVLHASDRWSLAQIDLSPDEVRAHLLRAFSQATGATIPDPLFVRAHRWRYARVDEPLGVDSLWDPNLRLGICGDWCRGSRVEAAFLSGLSLAHRLLGQTR